jgi:hypothetical protein
MKSEAEDRATVEQLQVAFTTLALEKPVIGDADIARAGLSLPLQDYLKSAMPKTSEGAYDFSTFVKDAFLD